VEAGAAVPTGVEDVTDGANEEAYELGIDVGLDD
jgi:hypothetical protein